MRTRSLLGCVVVSAWVVCAGCSDRAPATEADTVRCLVPASAALTNFSIGTTYNDQTGVESFTNAYPGSLTLIPLGDTVRVSGMVDTYSSFNVAFAACVDASAFAGLAFELGGSVGPTGMLTFVATTRENSPEPPFTATGTCVPQDPSSPFANCHSAYIQLAVPPTPAPATVRFGDLNGGMPVSGVDAAQLLSLGFSFSWTSTAQPYAVDLTLGNVSLVH